MKNNKNPKYIVSDDLVILIDSILVIEKLTDNTLKVFIKDCGAEHIESLIDSTLIWKHFKSKSKSIKSDPKIENVEFLKVGNKIIQMKNMVLFEFRDPNLFQLIIRLNCGIVETLPIEINLPNPQHRNKLKEYIKNNSLNPYIL